MEEGVVAPDQASLMPWKHPMQLGIGSYQQDFSCRVVDFAVDSVASIAGTRLDQIERVEGRSDAYHLDLGGQATMVAHLLELTRNPIESETP